MKPLIIYTDGSCLGNPGPGGWAAIIQDGKVEVVLSGHEGKTTNNRMEMTAVIRAMQWMKAQYKTERSAKLFSDSSLIVKSVNERWKRKNNKDLWAEFDEASGGLEVEMNWVKGHANNPLNERCDALAVDEAEQAQRESKRMGDAGEIKVESGATASAGEYFCGNCGTASDGLLGYMTDSDKIRVDCPHCGKYIKFASPTSKNLKCAKERPLITKAQLAALQKQREADGEPMTERQIKELKKMTQAEAQVMMESKQKLF